MSSEVETPRGVAYPFLRGIPRLRFAALGMTSALLHFDCGDGDCGDAFALPDWAELFVRRRFHAHVGFAHTDCCRNVLSHRRTVRGEFWRFGDHRYVNIDDPRVSLV